MRIVCHNFTPSVDTTQALAYIRGIMSQPATKPATKITKFPRQSQAAVNRPRRKACQFVAKCIGAIATMLVALSVWHLTCAVSTLTGSAFVLSLFLAVGIDLGLIASELAELVAHGNVVVARWSRAYMVKATVLSVILNAYEFAAHAPDNTLSKSLAITFGILLPVMIFILARIAAHLHQAR